MPRYQRSQSTPITPARKPTDEATPPPPSPAGLTSEQIDRWAALIANGRDAFPDDLPSDDCDRLLIAVRERLRGRLVHFIARAIAARLDRRARPGKEDPDHA